MMEYLHYFIDFFLHLDVHLSRLVAEYDTWVYAILFVIIFCETGLVVTPFLPGDSLLFVAGTLCTVSTNHLNIALLVPLMAIAAIAGDAINYAIGQFFGKSLFSNPNSRIFRQSYLDKTHRFYEKYGGKTIILARFVPIVRTFAPFVAGMGKMTYRRFAVFNVTGGIAWAVIFLLAGYFFGTLDFVKQNLQILVVVIIFISVMPAVIEVMRAKWKSSRNK
ncbi:membrane protein [Bacteroidia bacterium]|nr:membrane protein [Bacteroidia bacterium]